MLYTSREIFAVGLFSTSSPFDCKKSATLSIEIFSSLSTLFSLIVSGILLIVINLQILLSIFLVLH